MSQESEKASSSDKSRKRYVYLNKFNQHREETAARFEKQESQVKENRESINHLYLVSYTITLLVILLCCAIFFWVL